MQNVNLLDARWVPAAPRAAQPLVVLGVATLVLAAVAVGAHGLHEQRALAQALAAQDHAATATQPTEAKAGDGAARNATEQAGLRKHLAQREALLAALQRERPGPSHPAQTLNSVLQALPATVWLNELELQGEQHLRITGGSLDPQALAHYAHQLSRAPSLRGTALKTVRLETATEPLTDLAAPDLAQGASTAARPPARLQGPRSHLNFELASAPATAALP